MIPRPNEQTSEQSQEELVDEVLEQESWGDSEGKARIETTTEFGQFLIVPAKSLKKSIYDKFIQKDMAVSYIKGDDEITLMHRYAQLVNNFVFISMEGQKEIKNEEGKTINVPIFNPIIDMASIYNAEKLAYLELWRSRNGFEREKLTTVTHVKKDMSPLDKLGWFGGKRGQQQ